MKLRYLIPSFLAVVGLFTACSDDNDPTYLDEVRLSSSYVAIPQDGGQTTITVTRDGNKAIDTMGNFYKAFTGVFKDSTLSEDGKMIQGGDGDSFV